MQPIGIDKEKIKAENPEAVFLDIDLDDETHSFAFSRPKRAHVDMALTQASGKLAKNMSNLVMACLIAPARHDLIAFFEYYPAATTTLGGKLLDVVGLKDADQQRP